MHGVWSTIIPPVAGAVLFAWWLFLCVDARKAYRHRAKVERAMRQISKVTAALRATGAEVEVTAGKMRALGDVFRSEHERGRAADG